MSGSNHAYSAISFITGVLVLIPLPWHLEAWNTGTVMYMIWTALAIFINFINSIVWNGNIVNHAPVYCDIATKLIVGSAMGINSASLCINRRLYYIASVQKVTNSKRDRVRAMVVDLSICIGLPVILMALHVIVQGHRFDIFEDLGCLPATYNVTLAYVLVQGPLLIVPVITSVYSVMSIISFRKRHDAFNEVLASLSSSLTSTRYLRLVCLASVQVLVGLPLSIAMIVVNATSSPVDPWVSWAVTHEDFGRVDKIPAILWRSSSTGANIMEVNRYLPVICGLIFFMFFGFAEEANRKYMALVDKTCKLLGVRNPFKKDTSNTQFNSKFGNSGGSSNFSKFKISTPGTGGNGSNAALPIYVQKEVINRRDSIDTMSDFMSVRSGGDSHANGGLVKIYPNGLTHPNPSESTVPSRSGSPTTAGRPRIEISSAIYPDDSNAASRAPESSFPTSVTPEPTSFLEMATPAGEGVLGKVASKKPVVSRADNRI